MEGATGDAGGPGRLVSVDALRGFDMFWIIGGNKLVVATVALFVTPVPPWLRHQLSHAEWEGFTAWDLIMPLFLFVAGVSMPFSFSKRMAEGKGGWRLYAKIARRTAILFVLGIAAQGNLFQWDLSKLHLYCNTLQSIAAGYLVGSIALLNLSVAGQLGLAVALLIGYWLLMVFVPVPGHGAGVIEPGTNLAMYVDETLLGRFRDGTTYTWILSSMTFASTVMLGVMGGHILRTSRSPNQKSLVLVGAGIACLALGWIWSHWFPIIKHIWTSSMVLWAAGWSYLLLAVFYWIVDARGYKKWAFPFVVIGMNAIVVYMATEIYYFPNMADSFVGSLKNSAPVAWEFLRQAIALAIIWCGLLYMYRNKTFVRV